MRKNQVMSISEYALPMKRNVELCQTQAIPTSELYRQPLSTPLRKISEPHRKHVPEGENSMLVAEYEKTQAVTIYRHCWKEVPYILGLCGKSCKDILVAEYKIELGGKRKRKAGS